ncbi:MAG: hypothetical protein JJE39_03805 [Vicinamibacteria bacterium]|nr:hypothetical protein [Vicinamibacteria bacterium]
MQLLFSFLVLGALTQSVPARPYSEERQLLDRHLAQLSRALPDAPLPDDDDALLRRLAKDAGLRNVEVGAPTITETGSLGQSRRALTANSTYPDADRFFRLVQGSTRLIDVEGLILRSADFGVRIEARLRFYHRAARVVPIASLDPARMRDRTKGATREEAALFARDEQLVLEKTIALDDLRRRQTSPRMFLAETGASFRDAAAALTFGSLDGDTGRFTLRGVVAGMGAAEALEHRLGEGFFRLREFSQARRDGCYQFEVVGESFRAGPQAALPLPVDEPFRPTEPFCRQDRDGVIAGTVGIPLRAAGSEPGGLFLRAVDTDIADIAAMIEALTRAPFVVAGDVVGRVSVDFGGASVRDALTVLPVRSDQIGEVWLLRSAASAAFQVQDADPEPGSGRFSFRAKRARGEDFLAAMAETEPSFAALGPPGLARVSVFAREASAGEVRRAALAALQLDESREENARVLRPRDGASQIGPITAGPTGPIVFRPPDLTVDELLLAGIGRSGSELLAFVYSPLGDIVALRLGDNLADGVIAALDSNGLLVDTSEGPVRISTPAPLRAR